MTKIRNSRIKLKSDIPYQFAKLKSQTYQISGIQQSCYWLLMVNDFVKHWICKSNISTLLNLLNRKGECPVRQAVVQLHSVIGWIPKVVENQVEFCFSNFCNKISSYVKCATFQFDHVLYSRPAATNLKEVY